MWKVDLAKTMAEMFQKADANKDEVMDLKEFQSGVMAHPKWKYPLILAFSQ